jgi:cyclic pyranopterin phosphate synthase
LIELAGGEPEDGLTHLDESGAARMVDVGGKDVTAREARAQAHISMSAATLDLIREGNVPKGDVFATARLAGVMAAKKAPELIPLCHPINLDSVVVDFEIDDDRTGLKILATARATDRTGVEMEALVAAGVAALTVYDMCKAADRGMEISSLRLLSKTGGKSGAWEAPA